MFNVVCSSSSVGKIDKIEYSLQTKVSTQEIKHDGASSEAKGKN